MNEMPATHRLLGESIARSISPSGALVTALGQSVTGQAWAGLISVLAADEFDAELVSMSCGGCTVVAWHHAGGEGWVKADRSLSKRGYSGDDVEVVWMEVTESQTQPPTAHDLDRILAVLKQEWPNVKMLFVSSRFYGGHRVGGGGEPAGWQSGLAVREFVLSHLGEAGPWIAWGPYLWANGGDPNGAGLTWEREDFAADGLHLSPIGREKAGHQLRSFFLSDDPLMAWFRAD